MIGDGIAVESSDETMYVLQLAVLFYCKWNVAFVITAAVANGCVCC